jgi:PHD/YefM family antitoxin component YafN of YafNO toxin-antitoxin module
MNYETSRKRVFSTAELSRHVGDVTHAASESPITITHHNKPRYVMMSVETFRQLNPRRVYKTSETPDDVAEWLLPALEAFARGEISYDDQHS